MFSLVTKQMAQEPAGAHWRPGRESIFDIMQYFGRQTRADLTTARDSSVKTTGNRMPKQKGMDRSACHRPVYTQPFKRFSLVSIGLCDAKVGCVPHPRGD